jgi:prepilin-type processing-associated H-X9-DG protein
VRCYVWTNPTAIGQALVGTPVNVQQAFLNTTAAPLTWCGGRMAHTRHSGGQYYVFVDGHAKWARLEQTVSPQFLWGPPVLRQTLLYQ